MLFITIENNVIFTVQKNYASYFSDIVLMKEQLLQILICPICHSKLFMNSQKNVLICSVDNIYFPIKQGIPIILKEESQSLLNKSIE